MMWRLLVWAWRLRCTQSARHFGLFQEKARRLNPGIDLIDLFFGRLNRIDLMRVYSLALVVLELVVVVAADAAVVVVTFVTVVEMIFSFRLWCRWI